MLVRKIIPGYAVFKEMGLALASDFDTLYKFRSFAGESRKRVLAIIRDSRIFFPYPTSFNDPFDVMPIFRHRGDPSNPRYVARLRRYQRQLAENSGRSEKQIERELAISAHELPKVIEREVRLVLREHTRMLCLSADHVHALQWSHYADCHRGVSLHFWCVPGSPFGSARRVRYTSRRAIGLSFSSNSDDQLVDKLAFTKAKFWSYEHEYRLIIPRDTPNAGVSKQGYFDFPQHALKGITLGMQMPARDRNSLIRFLARNRPDLAIWQAYPDEDKFELKVRELGVAKKLARDL